MQYITPLPFSYNLSIACYKTGATPVLYFREQNLLFFSSSDSQKLGIALLALVQCIAEMSVQTILQKFHRRIGIECNSTDTL